MARSLTTIARELNSACARKWGPRAEKLPPLLFMTDETRTPDPAPCLEHLPQGTGVIFRHYNDPERIEKAKKAALQAAKKQMIFLVAEDVDLARGLDASGVHLPERALGKADELRSLWPDALITAAVHSYEQLVSLPESVDAALLSPIFPTQSHEGAPALGLQIACEWASAAPCPVYALGGVDENTAASLKGTPFCGLAGISFFLEGIK
ncbi:MAG: thiamine phosphate synthase [Alphaproteobacteria bacterium]|nr:MAG: thiamine phosphate synthase [Alphaproteobacteria bacterium]